ncbi:hypothetical protein D4S03_07170 [bacterium]|nr:MAG: hypothetical protein D4S03_07170 [bacterium]
MISNRFQKLIVGNKMEELLNDGFVEIESQPIIELVSSKFVTNRLDVNYYRPEYLRLDRQLQSLDFQQKRMVDLSKMVNDGPGGWSLQSSEYSPKGIPLIRIVDFRSNLDPNGMVYIPIAKHEELLRYEVLPGDVLITAAGSIGEAQILPQSIAKANFRDLIRIRLKSGVDPYYLSAYLNSKNGRMITRRFAHGAVQLHLKVYDAKEILVVVPDPKIQAYIGSKVRLAEKCREEADKIKKSAQDLLSELLELPSIDQLPQYQIAWWVDANHANPERLDPNYYQPKFLKTVEILRDRSSRFSQVLVNTKYGASVPADYKEDGIPFIRGTDLIPNRIDVSDLHYLDASISNKIKSAKIKKGDILLTRSGTVGTAAAVTQHQDDYAFGSFMIRLRFKEELLPFYIAAFLNSPYGILQIERQKNGAVQQNINLEEIDRLFLPNLLIDQQKEISNLWKRWNLLLDKSQSLLKKAISDVEKLIQGELEVKAILLDELRILSWDDIEEEVEKHLTTYA